MAHGRNNPKEHVPVTLGVKDLVLKDKDKEALRLLVKASEVINQIFFKHSGQSKGKYDPSKPAVFYPGNLTKEEFTTFINTLSNEERKKFVSPYTIIERGEEGLVAVQYSEVFKEEFSLISNLLLTASVLLSEYPEFSTYLKKRADSFLTNNFKESDEYWVRSFDAPFEVVIGPYEEYEDTLFGYKRCFESIVGVVNPEYSKELEKYQEEVIQFDKHLSEQYGYTPSAGTTPMTALDEIYASGAALYSYIPMAANLPNDVDVHARIGSKKIYMVNVIEAKLNTLTKPILMEVLGEGHLGVLDNHLFFGFIVGHELSHGLGFRFYGEHFEGLGSIFEEAKADVFGINFFFYLKDKGVVEENIPFNICKLHIADVFRQIRFGIEQAHAASALMQLNWFMEKGACSLENGKIIFHEEKFERVYKTLGDELFKLTQSKSIEDAKTFKAKWGGVPGVIVPLIEKIKHIPIDIDPVFITDL